MTHLIWWTSQDDLERIEHLGEAGMLRHWPQYLYYKFSSRNARAGRGRLWVAEELEKDAPPPPEEAEFRPYNPVCRMAANCGGIVIRYDDIEQVRHLPGFLTTFKMQIWHPLPALLQAIREPEHPQQ